MTTIDLTAADGHRLAAYRRDPAGAPRGAVVVAQEIFGVNSHIRAVCDRFAEAGYVAIAPALFDRVERDVELGYDQAAMERGVTLRAGTTLDLALADIAAARAAAAGLPAAVVGYCWGGTLAWAAACRLDGIAAAVGYYGSGISALAGERPRCPVMLHFGEQDKGIPLTDVEAIRTAHPLLPIHTYPAGHGFNCDQRAAYHAPSATLALERTLAFMAGALAADVIAPGAHAH